MATYLILPIETLHKLLICNAGTGKLYWKARPRSNFPSKGAWVSFNSRFAGVEALKGRRGKKREYLAGEILGVAYSAHRVIYAMHHGKWPDGQIDHINQKPRDNRIANLRAVDNQTNLRNRPMTKANTSGCVGVYWNKKNRKWNPKIRVDDRLINLGSYDKFKAAVSARKDAERKYGFHPNHGNSGGHNKGGD